jgi:hypothetical protein
MTPARSRSQPPSMIVLRKRLRRRLEKSLVDTSTICNYLPHCMKWGRLLLCYWVHVLVSADYISDITQRNIDCKSARTWLSLGHNGIPSSSHFRGQNSDCKSSVNSNRGIHYLHSVQEGARQKASPKRTHRWMRNSTKTRFVTIAAESKIISMSFPPHYLAVQLNVWCLNRIADC